MTEAKDKRPVLAITMGDINGVGPEVLAKALANPAVWACCRPVVMGDASVLEGARRFAPNCPPARALGHIDEAGFGGDSVPVLASGAGGVPCRPGTLDAEAGRCAVEWIQAGVGLALAGYAQGLVTCPINKEGIRRAGFSFSGHTDMIAELTGSPEYWMCLFAGAMRVVHITAHLSLARAIEQVRKGRVAAAVRVAHEALVRLGLDRGRIAVAGLNPHAGEAGAFGMEEMNEIHPAVAQCRREGIECSGPYPPDTVFRRMSRGDFDLVVAMYHDQGHIPLKLVAMDDAVNVTLGIPIVRTSVGHGTAYDIAGKGLAQEQSLVAAIELASLLAGRP